MDSLEISRWHMQGHGRMTIAMRLCNVFNEAEVLKPPTVLAIPGSYVENISIPRTK